MKVDAHQHFWVYNEREFAWVEPALARDFLPGDLESELRAQGYAGTVAVQAPQSLAESEFLLGLSGRNPWILGVVGWVDLCGSSVEGDLERLAANPKFVGVRHIVQGEPDERFTLRPDFLRGLGLLEDLDLAYDLLIFPRHLPAAIEVVSLLPRQRFVIDHMAKPDVRHGEIEPWATQIRELSRRPNVYCKLSGLVTEAGETWTARAMQPFADVVLEAFGPDRVMIGSDWPVCLSRGHYSTVMATYETLAGKLSTAEQTQVFGGTAVRFYALAT